MAEHHCDDPRCAGHGPDLAEVRERVAKYGWAVQGVLDGGGSPAYAYTVGLSETFPGQPELAVVGLPPDLAKSVLNGAGDLVRLGARFAAGQVADDVIGEGYRVKFREMDLARCGDAFAVSDEYFQSLVPRLQILIPDVHDRLPDEEGCDPEYVHVQLHLIGA